MKLKLSKRSTNNNTSDRDIAAGLILSGLAKLFNSASVFARVVGFGFADGKAALALVVGDEEADV